MPNLPTISVTQAQADRMLAAFGDAAGYKEWLRARIVEEVERVELRALDEQSNVAKRQRRDELAAAMPAAP